MKKLTALLITLSVLLAGCYPRAMVGVYPPPAPPEPSPLLMSAQDAEPNPEPYEYIEADPEPEPPVNRGPMVALTFDDGPSAYTETLLDLLEYHNARATFFVLGYRVQGRRSTIIRAVDLGSEIAGHSWDHSRFTNLNEEQITQQIERTSAAIEAVTGVHTKIYRPPFGTTNELVQRVSADLGYSIINWTVDPRDWKYRDADDIYDAIMDVVESGDIIVAHDIYASTIEAMKRVIPSLIERGYELVTVSELLEYLHGELEPGEIYGNVFEPAAVAAAAEPDEPYKPDEYDEPDESGEPDESDETDEPDETE